MHSNVSLAKYCTCMNGIYCFEQMSLSVSPSEFEVIQANLNVELITPVLDDVGLLTPLDKVKLADKSEIPAVKLILKKAKQHSEGSKLFCNALQQTKADGGHRKILQVLSLPGKGTSVKTIDILNVQPRAVIRT